MSDKDDDDATRLVDADKRRNNWLTDVFSPTWQGAAAPIAVGCTSIVVMILILIERGDTNTGTALVVDSAAHIVSMSVLGIFGVWQLAFAFVRYGSDVDVAGFFSSLLTKGSISVTSVVVSYAIVLLCVELSHHDPPSQASFTAAQITTLTELKNAIPNKLKVDEPNGASVVAGFGVGIAFAVVLFGLMAGAFDVYRHHLPYVRSTFISVIGIFSATIGFMYYGKDLKGDSSFETVSIVWTIAIVSVAMLNVLALLIAGYMHVAKNKNEAMRALVHFFVTDMGLVDRPSKEDASVNRTERFSAATQESAFVAFLPFGFLFIQVALLSSHFEVFGCDPTVQPHPNAAAFIGLTHCLALDREWLWIMLILSALGTIGIGVSPLMKYDHVLVDKRRPYLGGKAPTFTSAKRDGDNNASYATVATGDDCDADDAVVTTPLKQREPHFRV